MPLPFSKHNTIKVTLTDGSTVLARITRVNEATGKVCWIDRDEKWKGSTHVSRVVVASPLEVATWSASKATKCAAIDDPCMAGYSLGKTKRGPQMMEGYYFAISVYKDNKKIGEIVDEGNGGPTMTRFKNHADRIIFEEACRKWCQKNGASMEHIEAESEFWQWWDEARPNGKDAATFFKEQKEEFAKMFPGPRPDISKQTPIHTGNLALVQGKI